MGRRPSILELVQFINNQPSDRPVGHGFFQFGVLHDYTDEVLDRDLFKPDVELSVPEGAQGIQRCPVRRFLRRTDKYGIYRKLGQGSYVLGNTYGTLRSVLSRTHPLFFQPEEIVYTPCPNRKRY